MEKQKTKNKYVIPISFWIGIVLVFLSFLASLSIGRIYISPKILWEVLIEHNKEEYLTYYNVVMFLRLPRTLAALLVGISLTLTGVIYQQLFNNNLVSSSTLGVSNGASVGAALCIVLGMTGLGGNLVLFFMSFVMGILTLALNVFLSKSFKQGNAKINLLLSGMLIAGIMTSIVSLIKTFANPDTTLPSIIFWTMGSFSRADMMQVVILALLVVPCFIIIFILRWRISLLGLGRKQAQTRGLNYNFYKWLLIIIGGVLISASVAVSGVISWVGLVLPNFLKLIFKNNNEKTIYFSIPIGAIFMIWVDILSRSITSNEIPISAISGILCLVPMIVVYLFRFKRGK
ncbi:FecCD family ABC transporter permease [Mycoplasmopsis hyopharyngis]|uniref:FecCD family ABC transporter permease n=1 Tax=Mycoplasmopsis hyopharyngis TaxID=29558 RepID=UPI0038738092